MSANDRGSGQPPAPPPNGEGDLISIRLMMILLLSVFAGLIVGLLAFVAGYNLAGAVLAGLFAGGTTLVTSPRIIR